MDPFSHAQQLCPLRPFGPSFLSENPPTRNRSHSPQPPARKRLYSEDFNCFLLESDARERPRPSGDLRDAFGDRARAEATRSDSRFALESHELRPKALPLFASYDQVEELLPEPPNFNAADAMRDEWEQEKPFSCLSLEAGRDEKPKAHFQEIFDAHTKDNALLGKREFPLRSPKANPKTSSGKSGVAREGGNAGGKLQKNLKVEEHSKYLFKPKRGKKATGAGKAFAAPKQKRRGSKGEASAGRREARGGGEKRGLQMHG